MKNVAFYKSTVFQRLRRSLSTCRTKLSMFGFDEKSTVYILCVNFFHAGWTAAFYNSNVFNIEKSQSSTSSCIECRASTYRNKKSPVEFYISIVAFYKSTKITGRLVELSKSPAISMHVEFVCLFV